MNEKILIVVSDYYKQIAENLIEGAKDVISENNLNYNILYAPGCFEIPLLISQNLHKYKGFIALGCIIRGETYHFELIANECARKIIDISNDSLKPIGFGIIACENIDQAIERSSINEKNKGKEAALACIKLIK